jgi:hypothetical protein
MKIASVIGCSRCGQDHHEVRFWPLDNPSQGCTHWSSCPTNGQPILMRLDDREDPKKTVQFPKLEDVPSTDMTFGGCVIYLAFKLI